MISINLTLARPDSGGGGVEVGPAVEYRSHLVVNTLWAAAAHWKTCYEGLYVF